MAEVKFTEEDIKSLNELSSTYQRIQSAFGQVRVQKIMLGQQQDSLEEAEVKLEADYTDNQQKERDLVKDLSDRYGPGTLDPETGIFTPTEVATEEVAEEVVEEAK